MSIENIMTRPVITCHVADTLNTSAGLMWENDCGALPVVDDEGACVGIITDRDICMGLYTSGRTLQTALVRDSMAKQVLSCWPTDDVLDVEKSMAHAQVRRVPVLDPQRRPIGIVSMSDFARFSTQTNKKIAAETLSTLAAISEPHRAMVRAPTPRADSAFQR